MLKRRKIFRMTFIRFIEILVLVILVGGAAAEWAFRCLKAIQQAKGGGPQLLTSYPPEYYWSMTEPSCWSALPLGVRVFFPLEESRQVISSNRQGFRTREFSLDETDRRKVVILGGSQSWGLGASSDQTVAAKVLEEILTKESGTPWQVYNLSMMGVTSQKEILYLIFWGFKLKPSFVISLTGYNDLHLPASYYSETHNVFLDQDVVKSIRYYEEHTAASGFLPGLKQFLFSQSEGLRFLKKRFNQERTAKEFSSVLPSLEQRIKNCAYNISLMNSLCREKQAEYMAVFQPVGYGKIQATEKEQKEREYFLKRHANCQVFQEMFEYNRTQGSIYKEILQQLRRQALDVKAWDWGPLFDREPRARFSDGITHLNDDGHRALAEKIAPEILAKYKATPSSDRVTSTGGRL